MKNNIIKFVSRDEFEARKFPLHANLINGHLDEIAAQMLLDGEILEEKIARRARDYLKSLGNNGTDGGQE